MAGLTAEGFITTTTEEQRIALANALRANLGQDIDTNPSSRIGQFIDIIGSELESLWLGVEAVYDSQFVVSASGQALDNIGSVINTPRNPGSGGFAQVYFGGQLGTAVPSGTLVSHVNGFELATKEARSIVANSWLAQTDLIPTSDKADFDVLHNGVVNSSLEIYATDTSEEIRTKVAESSRLKLKIHTLGRGYGMAAATCMPGETHPFKDGDVITIVDNDGGFFSGTHHILVVPDNTEFAWDDTGGAIPAREVFNSYVLGPALAQVSVAGQFSISGGIWVKFVPNNPADIFGFSLTNNNMLSAATQTTMKVEQATDQSVIAEGTSSLNQSFGPHTIIKLVSSIGGLGSVINLAAGTPAIGKETDAEYRARLQGEFTTGRSSSIFGISDAIKALSGVTWVAIVDNPLSTADAQGRPAHSMELYVEGGDDNTIAQKLYDLHPAGISIVSTASAGLQRSGIIVDVNGDPKTIYFSSVQLVDIKVGITGTKNTTFPTDGYDQIKNAIVNYVNSLDIGETLYSQNLYAVVNTIPGILTLNITAAKLSESLTPNAIIDPSFLKKLKVIASNINISLT